MVEDKGASMIHRHRRPGLHWSGAQREIVQREVRCEALCTVYRARRVQEVVKILKNLSKARRAHNLRNLDYEIGQHAQYTMEEKPLKVINLLA